MTWFDRLLRRDRLYGDLSEEIRAHLEEKADHFVAQGMSRAAALAAARRAFGNVTQLEERGREVWQWPTLESFAMDIRFALRQLRRAPGLTATVLLTLGIGIAANATVFSWTSAILLDPLPGSGDPNRVLALESTTASGSWTPTSWPDYRDLRGDLRSIDGLAASYPLSLAIGAATDAERRWSELVSANFFDVLRVRPALGRFFARGSDDAEGGEPAVVISHAFWRSRWQGDSAVIGRVLYINRFPFTIVGVAPATFHGSMPGEAIDAWVPAAMVGQIIPTGRAMLRDRAWRTFRVLARLAPGASLPAARDEVERVATIVAARNGGRSVGMSATVMPLWRSHWGMQDSLRAPLLVLMGACGLVLLIVCANMANLLLARATGRRRELGLRHALGAQRARLVRQLLTEASLLAFAGSALGLLGTLWLSRSLGWLVPSLGQATLVAPHVDVAVLAFTATLACVVTLAGGIAPALHGSREQLGDALAAGGRGAVSGVHVTRARNILVIGEMALAVISLVGAGLFYESFRNTRAVSPGFNADHVAMGSVSLTLAGYDSAHGDAFLERVAEAVRSHPGVTAATYADYVPLSVGAGSWEDLVVDGYAPDANENMKLYRAAIGTDYFKVLGIPLVQGRDFRIGDDSSHTPVMIVNEAFVRHFLRDRAALGVRVRGWGKWFTIVGVAKDAAVYRLTDPPTPYFYVPVRQVYRPEYGYAFLARTTLPEDDAVSAIAKAARAADPGIPVFNAMPLAEYVGAPLRVQETAARLLSLLAVVAVLLAAIGLYGVIAYMVAQQTKEFGVRVALGARPSDVARTVAARAGALLVGGLIIGLIGAAALARVVSSLLYSVGAGDPTVFAVAAGGMALIAAAATAIPARRAMSVDPIVALRAD